MVVLTALGHTTIIVSWSFTGVALLSIISSTAIACFMQKRMYASDWLNFAAFITALVLVSQNTYAILVEGQSEHQSDLSPSQIDTLAKSIIVHEALWSLSNAIIRISACLLLKRLFGILGWPKIVMISAISLSALHGLASVLDLSLICRPLSAQWKSDIDATCGNQWLSFLLLEVLGMLVDCSILVVPALAIMRLHVPNSRRLALLCVFEVGALLLIITGLRLKSISYATSPDFVYSQSYLGLLSGLGVMLGVASCTATQLPLILRSIRDFYRNYRPEDHRGSGYLRTMFVRLAADRSEMTRHDGPWRSDEGWRRDEPWRRKDDWQNPEASLHAENDIERQDKPDYKSIISYQPHAMQRPPPSDLVSRLEQHAERSKEKGSQQNDATPAVTDITNRTNAQCSCAQCSTWAGFYFDLAHGQ